MRDYLTGNPAKDESKVQKIAKGGILGKTSSTIVFRSQNKRMLRGCMKSAAFVV